MVSYFRNSGKYTVSINKWPPSLKWPFAGRLIVARGYLLAGKSHSLPFNMFIVFSFLQAVWLVTFTAVVILDVALGLLIGIVFSLYFVLQHSQK